MSRYDEISELATAHSRRIFALQRTCKRVAAQLVKGYADFLGCPLHLVEFVRLDKELQMTDAVEPFTGDVPLILDTQGFWYFCVRIKFEKPSDGAFVYEQTRLGLRYEDDVATVRERRDFELRPDQPETAEPLYQYLFEDSKKEFNSPFRLTSPRRIGFVV